MDNQNKTNVSVPWMIKVIVYCLLLFFGFIIGGIIGLWQNSTILFSIIFLGPFIVLGIFYNDFYKIWYLLILGFISGIIAGSATGNVSYFFALFLGPVFIVQIVLFIIKNQSEIKENFIALSAGNKSPEDYKSDVKEASLVDNKESKFKEEELKLKQKFNQKKEEDELNKKLLNFQKKELLKISAELDKDGNIVSNFLAKYPDYEIIDIIMWGMEQKPEHTFYEIIYFFDDKFDQNIITEIYEKQKDLSRYLIDFSKLEKLYSLITKKHPEATKLQLIWILIKEKQNIIESEITNILRRNKEKDLDGYLSEFYENYEDQYTFIELSYLYNFLCKNDIKITGDQLRKKLADVAKNYELNQFENKLKSNEKVVTIKDIDEMSGYKFEEFLIKLYKRKNYKIIEHTKLSNDQGADLVVEKSGKKYVIQAKNYKTVVGNDAIQQVVASIRHYDADRGIVITNSTFTRQATELAKSNDIELIDREELKEMIEKYF